MIQIVLNRSLSLVIACSDGIQWERGDTSHRWRDKSADVRRAHVVGWVGVLRRCTGHPTGASHGNTNVIKLCSAIPHFGRVALRSCGTPTTTCAFVLAVSAIEDSARPDRRVLSVR